MGLLLINREARNKQVASFGKIWEVMEREGVMDLMLNSFVCSSKKSQRRMVQILTKVLQPARGKLAYGRVCDLCLSLVFVITTEN